MQLLESRHIFFIFMFDSDVIQLIIMNIEYKKIKLVLYIIVNSDKNLFYYA